MANDQHVEKLCEGIRNWNEWREQNPEIKPDLSGLDLTQRKIRDAISTNSHGAYYQVVEIKLSDTNLKNAVLKSVFFESSDLRGADLSGAQAQDCRFESCLLGEPESAIDERMREVNNLTRTDETFYRSRACTMNQTRIFGASFNKSSLCYVDLTTVFVDEKTSLEQVGVINTKISRSVIEQLRDYGGLTIGRLRRMIHVDDVADLRRSFSGFWNQLHFVALVVFFAPYLWFIANQWLLARVGDETPDKDASSPILINLIRFIVSGGDTWREWSPSFIPILLFVVALVFNVLRACLLAKTLDVEHYRSVHGHYPDFTLTGKWFILHQGYKWLGAIALLVLVVHTFLFLLKRVPLA
jgi:hypothetical protein